MVDLHPDWWPKDTKEFEVAFKSLYRDGVPTRSQKETVAEALNKHRAKAGVKELLDQQLKDAVDLIDVAIRLEITNGISGYDSTIESQAKQALKSALCKIVLATENHLAVKENLL